MTGSTRTSVPGVPTVPSARSRLAAAACEIGLRPLNNAVPMNAPGVLFARKLIATIMATAGPTPRGISVVQVRSGAVRGKWVRAPGVDFGSRAIYYIHGKGYVFCSARTHRGLAAQLSRKSGLPVFRTDYRPAPEHRFPAAADDVGAGYRWLLDRGFAAQDLVIACDSTSGHLALDLLIENDRRARPQPAAVAMFSPLIDLTFGLATEQERRQQDPIIAARAASRLPYAYTRDLPADAPRLRLQVPPGMTMPPLLVQADGAEMLTADAGHLHAMVRDAGQVHVFQALPLLMPQADKALDRAAEFLRTALISQTVAKKVS